MLPESHGRESKPAACQIPADMRVGAPVVGGRNTAVAVGCLQAATALGFAYLCAGEFIPKSALPQGLSEGWARQEVLILAALSFLTVLLASAGGCSGHGCEAGVDGSRAQRRCFSPR